jgi:hypothetical protein
VLDAEANGLRPATRRQIADNPMLVTDYEEADRSGLTIIDEIVSYGDSTDQQYSFGVYENRVPVYQPIDVNTAYTDYIVYSSTRNGFVLTDNGAKVPPWAVRPGKTLRYVDFLPGYLPDSLRSDPRVMIIEGVTYTMPFGLQIQAGQSSNISQKLNNLGLGGI